MDFTTGKEYEARQEENKTTCYSDSSSVSRPQGTEKTEDPVIDNKEVVEDDLTEISSEELKKREKLKAAIMLKEKGNKFYKDKRFEEALSAYDEAIALDPTNMTFLSNK